MTARPAHLPGTLSRQTRAHRAIRVNQAGEYGAKRIYEGQLAVLGVNHPLYAPIKAMADQEQQHLDKFDALMTARRVRPTALAPLWHVAGYALGAATALIGPKAAMACTDAIESVIVDHYARQYGELKDDEPELAATIDAFRADEEHHREAALAHGAQEAPAYPMLTGLIKAGCAIAIKTASRI